VEFNLVLATDSVSHLGHFCNAVIQSSLDWVENRESRLNWYGTWRL